MGLVTLLIIGAAAGGAAAAASSSGGGGGGAPSPGPMPPPAPKAVTGVEEAKKGVRDRMRRARSRAGTRVTQPGLLQEEAPTSRPLLSNVLG